MDIEKFAEAFAKRGLVPTIHIHEGNQIHDNQIENLFVGAEPQDSGDNAETPTARAKDTTYEGKTPEDQPEEFQTLLMVLKGNHDLCRDLVQKARYIVCASDFRTLLRPVFERHGFNLRAAS